MLLQHLQRTQSLSEKKIEYKKQVKTVRPKKISQGTEEEMRQKK